MTTNTATLMNSEAEFLKLFAIELSLETILVKEFEMELSSDVTNFI